MTKQLAVAAIAAAAAFGGVSETRADDFERHIDEVAFDLMRQTASLAREVKYGYRHHPEFDHLYSDVLEMYQRADHIHDIAHVRGSLGHIKRDAEQLDELYHHVEEVLSDVERTSRFTNGYHRRRALQAMAALGDTIHHLLDDLDLPCGAAAPCPPTPPAPVVPTPGVYLPNHPHNQVIVPGAGRHRFGYAPGVGFTYRSQKGHFVLNIRR